MERYTDRYRTTMRWSDADNAYIAAMPALAGCIADGPTPHKALDELNVSAELWVEIAGERGWKIPKPDRELVTA
jgi:predicted RNase H-like HicB family nuclease